MKSVNKCKFTVPAIFFFTNCCYFLLKMILESGTSLVTHLQSQFFILTKLKVSIVKASFLIKTVFIINWKIVL